MIPRLEASTKCATGATRHGGGSLPNRNWQDPAYRRNAQRMTADTQSAIAQFQGVGGSRLRIHGEKRGAIPPVNQRPRFSDCGQPGDCHAS